MAKNTGDRNSPKGSVKDRTQVQDRKPDSWTRDDVKRGRFTDAKSSDKPFKGAEKESSAADKKMMRAWNTINENRNGVKGKH